MCVSQIVCVCESVCVCTSLQGGVFLLLSHLLFQASYNIEVCLLSATDWQCEPLAVCVWQWFLWCFLTTLLICQHFNRFSHWSNGNKLKLISWRFNVVKITYHMRKCLQSPVFVPSSSDIIVLSQPFTSQPDAQGLSWPNRKGSHKIYVEILIGWHLPTFTVNLSVMDKQSCCLFFLQIKTKPLAHPMLS